MDLEQLVFRHSRSSWLVQTFPPGSVWTLWRTRDPNRKPAAGSTFSNAKLSPWVRPVSLSVLANTSPKCCVWFRYLSAFLSLGCDVMTSRPVLRPNWTYWANGPWLSLGLSIVWDKAPLLLYVSRSSPIVILPAKRFEPESYDSLDVRLGSFSRLSQCWTSTRLQRSFVLIQKPFIHFGSI